MMGYNRLLFFGGFMKKLILIGGPMGVGKTAVSKKLCKTLDHCVFLDGDWCWDMHPFIVDEETKKMVMNNIVYQLNQFLLCSSIHYVVFCWVMHEQSLIEEIINRIESDCEVYSFSLVCTKEELTKRIQKDIDLGIRQQDVLNRSIERLEMYQHLQTIKVDTSMLSIDEVVCSIKETIISI